MATLVWGAGSNGGADHDWNNPLNWTGDVLPVDGDDVVLDPCVYSLDTTPNTFVNLNSLTVNAAVYGGPDTGSEINTVSTFPLYKTNIFYANLTVNVLAHFPASERNSVTQQFSFNDFVIVPSNGWYTSYPIILLIPAGASLYDHQITFNSVSVGGVSSGYLGMIGLYYTLDSDPSSSYLYPSVTVDVRDKSFYLRGVWAGIGVSNSYNSFQAQISLGSIRLLGGPSVGTGNFTLSGDTAAAVANYGALNPSTVYFDGTYNVDASFNLIITESTHDLVVDGTPYLALIGSLPPLLTSMYAAWTGINNQPVQFSTTSKYLAANELILNNVSCEGAVGNGYFGLQAPAGFFTDPKAVTLFQGAVIRLRGRTLISGSGAYVLNANNNGYYYTWSYCLAPSLVYGALYAEDSSALVNMFKGVGYYKSWYENNQTFELFPQETNISAAPIYLKDTSCFHGVFTGVQIYAQDQSYFVGGYGESLSFHPTYQLLQWTPTINCKKLNLVSWSYAVYPRYILVSYSGDICEPQQSFQPYLSSF